MTRKRVVRGAASCRDSEAFSTPAGEESETDRQEGRSKRQKERERGGDGAGAGAGARRRIRQQPTRLARPRVDACIGVRPSSREIRLEEGTNLSSLLGDPERGPWETDDVTQAEFRRLGGPAGRGGGQRAVTK